MPTEVWAAMAGSSGVRPAAWNVPGRRRWEVGWRWRKEGGVDKKMGSPGRRMGGPVKRIVDLRNRLGLSRVGRSGTNLSPQS